MSSISIQQHTSNKTVKGASRSSPSADRTSNRYDIISNEELRLLSSQEDSTQNQKAPNKQNSKEIIFSRFQKKGKVAASCYKVSTGELLLMESVPESCDLSTTIMAFRSVAPSIMVMPSTGAARFIKDLKARLQGEQLLNDCHFQCLASQYFSYSFARRTILESPLLDSFVRQSGGSKKTALISNVNLNDERLVCALGGLLQYLSIEPLQLGVGSPQISVTSFQRMQIDNKLWVDTESWKNLQIFDPQEHPSSFNWSNSNYEEGKSVFNLFSRNCSSVGMTRMRTIIANPTRCKSTLNKRHEIIDFYLEINNRKVVEALKGFVTQISSHTVIMGYLSSPTLRGDHWKQIYRHIYYTISYAEVCRDYSSRVELFKELGSQIVDSVYSMAHNLERVVDLENMENKEAFVIKYGFYSPLDAAKEKFSRLKLAMDKVTPHEFDTVPPFISKIQMMYIPEMKFLLSIPYWAPELTKEDLILPNLEFKFTANKTAFYKSRRCYELDDLLGDAQTDIIHEESLIIQSLKNYLKKHMHHIASMTQKIAEIECFFAIAKVSQEEHFIKPEILDGNIIEIKGGWHPLLNIPSNQIISNDTISSTSASLVKLVFGPNASGKSMYLKQVGLIVFLAHVGSYVPAAAVKLGLLDCILVRTTKDESVISMSSTMMTELKKLQDAVTGCNQNSLVILDEVGKGSTEMNCIAIVASAINHFLSFGVQSPHVIISTHLSGISDHIRPHSISLPGIPTGSIKLFELLVMEYVINDGEMIFLYKLRQGCPDRCTVFEIIDSLNLNNPILTSAKTVLNTFYTGDNLLPYCDGRIQRSQKFLNFIKKFVKIDMTKPGYLEKLQNKIQRYYEKTKH